LIIWNSRMIASDCGRRRRQIIVDRVSGPTISMVTRMMTRFAF
jgi:hypothetical protein